MDLSPSRFNTFRASISAGPSQAVTLSTAPPAAVVKVNSSQQHAGPSHRSLHGKRSTDNSVRNMREMAEQALQELNLSPSIFNRLTRPGTSVQAVDPMDVDNPSHTGIFP